MSQLRTRPWWQVLAVAAILLLTHPAESARNGKTKDKPPRSKKCTDCIQVRLSNRISAQTRTDTIRSFPRRSIVPFVYRNIPNSNGIPRIISEVVCENKCLGHERDMNAVPIRRNIHYLRRENNIYVLDEMNVTVGCTCVFPEQKEQIIHL